MDRKWKVLRLTSWIQTLFLKPSVMRRLCETTTRLVSVNLCKLAFRLNRVTSAPPKSLPTCWRRVDLSQCATTSAPTTYSTKDWPHQKFETSTRYPQAIQQIMGSYGQLLERTKSRGSMMQKTITLRWHVCAIQASPSKRLTTFGNLLSPSSILEILNTKLMNQTTAPILPNPARARSLEQPRYFSFRKLSV